MSKTVAINGSPRMEKGYTAMVLAPFLEGMRDAGSDVELFYASRLDVKPCTCGEMYCWYGRPGECCFQDDMQSLYPKLREADVLVLATPVYIPLPGRMQDLMNRLCPLIKPLLEWRAGRTRARFHEDVRIQRIALVSTGGWWEVANFDTVVRIVEDFTESASVHYAGAVLRPHAGSMKAGGELAGEGQSILREVRRAGYQLADEGTMRQDTLEAISRPLISEEELRDRYNRML
jgi:multimeric flavodoxin WrbA